VITADTNVFVYTVDPRDPQKQNIARRVIRLLEERRQQIALQVVGEYQNAIRRKLKLSPSIASDSASGILAGFATFPSSRSAAWAALEEIAAGRLSYWDALMLVSAAEAGCTAMLSEDMHDGAVLFGVEIVNPFGANDLSPRAAELLALA
jgi:predicted nucleic acid-binding protein